MAIVPTILGTPTEDAADLTTYVTEQVAPAANCVVVIDFYFRQQGAPDPTVTGVQWTAAAQAFTQAPQGQQAHDTSGNKATLFRYLGTTPPAADTISITGDQQHIACGWIISQWAGVDTPSNPIVGGNAAGANSSNSSVTSIAATLGATPAAGNAVVGVVSKGGFGDAITVPTGFTQLAALAGSSEDERLTLVWDETGAGAGPHTATWTGAQKASIHLVEFAPAAAAVGGAPARRTRMGALSQL